MRLTNLTILRTLAGLTQTQLGLASSLRQQQISAYEHGLVCSDHEHVRAIADGLGVEVALLTDSIVIENGAAHVAADLVGRSVPHV